MSESDDKAGNIGWVTEHTQRHERVAGIFLLGHDEQTAHHDTENDETDDFWR